MSDGLLVDEQHVDLVVGQDPVERIADHALGERHLVVVAHVHHHGLVAGLVQVLHAAGLGAHGAHLLACPEGLVDHGAGPDVLELGAHERAALAGFTCWNSTILNTCPSSSMWLPFLNWFVEITGLKH